MTAIRAVIVPLGADYYAVPIDWVREVLAEPTVTRLATAPAAVLGLLNVRGEIVPLLDTAALLGIGTVSTVAFAVVLRTQHGLAALVATAVPQRADFGAPLGRSELPGTAGMYQFDKRVAVLLDLAALLTPERLGGGHGLHAVPSSVGVG